jgi:chemotaxis family two-component system response regulator Rcp1
MSTLRENRNILLVEDSPGDVLLVREAMSSNGMRDRLHVVTDGADAIRFLEEEERPDLILLDLNLPVMDGREVLERIKTHPEWKSIPVAILSTSSSDEDVRDCYDHCANCYIVKPMDMVEFRRVVHAIDEFWLSVVQHPPRH